MTWNLRRAQAIAALAATTGATALAPAVGVASVSQPQGSEPLAAAPAISPSTTLTEGEGHGQQYYLALGDSVAFGFQAKKFISDLETTVATHRNHYRPNDFNTGYANDLAATLARQRPTTLTNMGCPDETTDSFGVPGQANSICEFIPRAASFSGGLITNPLHVPTYKRQLASAEAFLKQHRHEHGVITLDLGANDLLKATDHCLAPFSDQQSNHPSGALRRFVLACERSALPSVIRHVRRNLTAEVDAIQDAAPNADVVLVGYYNPFAVRNSRLSDGTTGTLLGDGAASDTMIRTFNRGAIEPVARTEHTQYADVFSFFNPRNASLEQSRLRKFTNYASPPVPVIGKDIHPNDRGYRKIASIIDATLRQEPGLS